MWSDCHEVNILTRSIQLGQTGKTRINEFKMVRKSCSVTLEMGMIVCMYHLGCCLLASHEMCQDSQWASSVH